MIVDSLLMFSDGQALTATAVSTNVVDVGSDRNIGKGEPMAIIITVGVAADFTTGDETYQFTLQTDSTDAFGSATTVIASAVIDGDQLPAGAIVVLPIGYSNEQFLRINNTLAGTTPIITIDAYLQPMSMIDSYESYADNVVIS